jgi:glycosyltransferase involved in cell wall biosynthesis
MNILFITLTRLHSNTTAGGELYLLDLIQGLSKVKVSPFLMYPDSKNKDNLYVRKYDSTGEYEEYECKGNGIEDNFTKIIKRFNIDIIHFQHFQTLPLSLMKISKDLNIKLILTLHDYFLWCENFFLLSPIKGDHFSFCSFEAKETVCTECLRKSKDIWELIYKQPWSGEKYSEEYVAERRKNIGQILENADLIISPTDYVRDSFLGIYPAINPSRMVVVEHGIHKIINSRRIYSHEYTNQLKIAFLGGFKYEKGSLYFNKLLENLKTQRVEFYIIGKIGTPLKTQNFKNLKIIGQYRREELGDILFRQGIDLIMLLSPWAETFSYTLSESIMNGIPVIATDIGALRERVSKLGTGFLVPYENPIPRTSRLLEDIYRNPKILEFFKKNCFEAAQSFKDINTMVEEYLSLYKKISGA